MPQRSYSRERTNVAKLNKRVVLPIGLEEYPELSDDSARFRCWLDSMIETCPELFPVEIAHGYVLHDKLPGSDKLPGVRFWRIMLNARDNEGKRAVLTVASSAVMPYMTSLTDDVDLVDRWRQVGADLVAFEFDASLDIPHNSVGPAADLAKKQLVYDRMLEPLGEQP